MALSCGLNCVKYLLFIFNFFFLLVGIIFIVLGAMALDTFQTVSAWMAVPTSGAVIVIVIGSVILLIAFFGCCGAIKENYCMIVTFAVLLGILFLGELAIGISIIVHKQNIEQILPRALNRTMNMYMNNSAAQAAWDFAQSTIQCCGINGPTDWNGKINVMQSVPQSCCIVSKANLTTCGYKVLNRPSDTWNTIIYTQGCFSSIGDGLSVTLAWFIGIVITVCVVQLIGVTCAGCLAYGVNNQYQEI